MSKARDLSKLDITDAVSVTVNNTATVAQMSTDANNALLVENTNAAGVSGLRMRGGSGKAAITYGENNSTDEFSIIPRNDASKAFTIDSVGNVVVAGNLQIEGSQTVLNTATLSVEDLNITVASGAANAAAANGAGLTVAGAAATLLYTATGDKWAFNKPLDVTGSMTSSGILTANAGVVVDNITIDGQEIDLSSGDFTLDVAGDINLDSDSGYVLFKDAGIEHARIFQNNSGDVNIASQISDKDMKFLGNDGGVGFTALTLDMSAAGNATFSGNVTTGASLISTNAIVDSLAVKTSTGSMLVKTSAGANIARFNNILTTDLFGSLDVTGNIIVSGTVDGVDLQTLNTTANAALPKAGGTMTGALTLQTAGATTAVLTLNNANGNGTLSQINLGYTADPDHGNISYTGDMIFTAGAAERMRISSVGNVHLNTGVDARVQLGTSGTGATSVSDNSVYIRGNNDDLILGAAGNGNISFKENADTRMFIKTGGNVGIGIINPSSKLHVQTSHTDTDVTGANSYSTLNIANSGAGNGVYNAIKFAANQQDMYIMSFNNNQQVDRRLGFFLGSVAGDAVADERLSILGSGNVGIGTTAPANKLHVKAGASGATTFDSRYNTIIEDDGENYLALYTPNNSFSGVRFLNANNSIRGHIDYYHGTQGDKFVMYSQNSFAFQYPSAGLQQEFKSNGNVNLGATHSGFSGWRVLNIRQSSTGGMVNFDEDDGTRAFSFANQGVGMRYQAHITGGYHRFETHAMGAGTAMMILDSGNVGIGTDSPAKKLHVRTTADGTLQRFTRQGVCDWDVSIGNTPIISGGSSGDLEIMPQNSNMGFAVGRAGQTGINMRVRDGVMTLGSGIKFNSDTAAANMLDDYEEGTWTPDLRRNDGSVSASFGVNNATYVKIGSIVVLKAFINNISAGSSNGSSYWRINGVPYASAVQDYSAESLAYNSTGANNVYVGDAGGNLILCNNSNVWTQGLSGQFMLNITYRVVQ